VNTGKEEKTALADRVKSEAELELDLPLNESNLQPSEDALPPSAGEDELDLSDLEAMLEDVEKETEANSVALPGADSELDIQTVVPDKTALQEMQGLDLTAIATPAEKTDISVEAEAEALDFTDLAGILDEKAPAADATDTKATVEQAGLAFEEQPPMEGVAAEAKAPSSIEDGLMLDLDQLLEEDDKAKAAIPEIQATAADELDLSLKPEPIREPVGELEIEPLTEGDEIAADQLSASTSVAAAATAAVAATTAGMAAEAATATGYGLAGSTATAVLEPEEEKTPTATKQTAKAAERSGGARKLLLAAAAIGVLAVAALVIPRGLGIHVPFLRDVEIPFLGKIFQTEPEDPIGNLKVMVVQESISAEFIENARVGKICVIQGQVRNNYDHPRSSIRVTGKLYDKNKSVVKMTTVFAGNMIPRDELVGQGMGVISSHLKNKDGAKQQNVGVKSGASIPFMIVFDGLPDNLDEYSVEVAGSSAG
jgi:hypothetical protein